MNDSPSDWIEFERRIVDLSEHYLGKNDYVAFANAQLWMSATDDRVTRYEQEINPSLFDVVQVASTLLGTPALNELAQAPNVIQTVVAMTSFLRSEFVLDREGHVDKPAASHPPQFLQRDRIPHALLSIYLLAEAANHAGMASITFQTVARIANHFRSLIALMAHFDTEVVWIRGAPIEAPLFQDHESSSGFVKLAKALLPKSRRIGHTTLGEALFEFSPRDPLRRTLFVKQAAVALAGRVERLENEGRSVYRSTTNGRVRAAVQRVALSGLSEQMLVSALSRMT